VSAADPGRLRVLVACELSGRTRQAFARRGWDAWSCDLQPADDNGAQHIQGDAREVLLARSWDLVIAHPPCTRLCNSGGRWLHERNLWDDMREACKLFLACLESPAPHVAVENPVMHKYAVEIIGRRQDFSVQPWQFGDPAKKRTCFWTANLPPLVPTSSLTAADARPECHHASPGPQRARLRSMTYPGIARAMADQWGAYVERHAAAHPSHS
jgi:hypothetical protein